MPNSSPLRIFVAMPGTTMGSNATFKSPEAVKKNLLNPVVEKLRTRLGREVALVIEKDKTQAGAIHESMFSEARDAEVYIADLTGANPNVYLELGVRWALRDRVTVPIAQSVEDLKFNVFANRVILYHAENLFEAIDDVVEAIENGLNNDKCDSLVRLNSDLLTIRKAEIDSLKKEIERLKRNRGEDLLRAALAAEKLSDRVSLLTQAKDANPASVQAWLELGKAYRDGSQYDDALDALTTAGRLDPNNAVVYRELGVCYSKQNKPGPAATSLREAVRLNPADAEAWSNLGGALRKVGMAEAPQAYDQKALQQSRDSYNEAHKLDKYDLYSGLNVARVDLLLSQWDPGLLNQAKQGFRKQLHLCRHSVEEKPEDYWRLFDLADALLFSGEYEESHSAFSNAIELVPKDVQKDRLLSPLGPLRDYLSANVLSGDLRIAVEKIVNKLEAARSAT